MRVVVKRPPNALVLDMSWLRVPSKQGNAKCPHPLHNAVRKYVAMGTLCHSVEK